MKTKSAYLMRISTFANLGILLISRKVTHIYSPHPSWENPIGAPDPLSFIITPKPCNSPEKMVDASHQAVEGIIHEELETSADDNFDDDDYYCK